MAQEEGPLALVLYHDADALSQAVASEEVPGAAEALDKYAALVRDVLVELCGLREFGHLEFLEAPTSHQDGDAATPLAVVVGTPEKDEDGQLTGVSGVKHVLDLFGALTASKALPAVLAEHVGLDDEGLLGFTDEESHKLADKFSKKLKLDDRFPNALTEEEEDALATGLGGLLSPDNELAPLAPEELLHSLPLFLVYGAGMSGGKKKKAGGAGGPGLFKRGRDLVGSAVHAPGSLLRVVGQRVQYLAQNVWRLEGVALATGKFALKAARKAVRPVLVGYVVHRALTTIDNSRALPVRMSKLPPKEALDLYYRTLLGPDYGKQIEQDLLDAAREVDEGLITEDYKEEKRLLSAAMLRRLEVEEWDKERMKHFYYGSYGLGPWYFDMEERLHNPYFIGARAWNGPVEGWVGKNKVYPNDLPFTASPAATAIDAIERSLGRTLTPEQRVIVLSSEIPRAADVLTSAGGLLEGVADAAAVEGGEIQPAA